MEEQALRSHSPLFHLNIQLKRFFLKKKEKKSCMLGMEEGERRIEFRKRLYEYEGFFLRGESFVIQLIIYTGEFD